MPQKPSNSHTFFNLTSIKIPTNILQIISKGTKHIPTPHNITNVEVDRAIQDCVNRTAWKILFKDKPQDTNNFDFRLNFKERPKPCYQLSNTPFINDLREKLNKATQCLRQSAKQPSNLRSTQQLVYFANSNPSIKITLTDKNLGLIFLDLKAYHSLVMTHLDTPNYEKIIEASKYSTSKFNHGTKSVFNKLCFQIEATYKGIPAITKFIKKARTKEYTPAIFHVLTKMHKNSKKLSSRPIVGAYSWYTTPISKTLSTILLKEFKMPFVLDNSFQLARSLKRLEIPPGAILVTLDVESLYTNIDTKLLSDMIFKQTGSTTIRAMLHFINNHNYFKYADLIWKQTHGIAMGTNAAPVLANYYMSQLFDERINQHESVFFYRRYLDDLFLIWTGSLESLGKFKVALSHVHPRVNFTMEQSTTSLPFLDIRVVLNNDKLEYYTFQKSLNKYAYITRSSCHPFSTIKGFIKAELIRYARLSSDDLYFNYTKSLFKTRLLKRGYSQAFLNPIFNQIQGINNPFKGIKAQAKLMIPMIFPHTKHPNMSQAILNLRNVKLSPTLPKYRLMTTYSKRKNTPEILCRSALTNAQILKLKEGNLLSKLPPIAPTMSPQFVPSNASAFGYFSQRNANASNSVAASAPAKQKPRPSSRPRSRTPTASQAPSGPIQKKITDYFNKKENF
jgi:hypothetical protein